MQAYWYQYTPDLCGKRSYIDIVSVQFNIQAAVKTKFPTIYSTIYLPK